MFNGSLAKSAVFALKYFSFLFDWVIRKLFVFKIQRKVDLKDVKMIKAKKEM